MLHLSSEGLARIMAEAGSPAAQLAVLEASPLFDAEFYLATNPDLAGHGLNLAQHYLTRGGVEARAPHPLFSGAHYLGNNPDVRALGVNPLIHFLESGAAEGRDPNPHFDALWYAGRYMADGPFAINPLVHYLENPANDPSPRFNGVWYRARFMSDKTENPLAHYVRVGIDAGHPTAP